MSEVYYKKVQGDEIFVKCVGDDGDYSVASNLDPEWDGYINHRWGEDTKDWTEITQTEAEEILGYNFETPEPEEESLAYLESEGK